MENWQIVQGALLVLIALIGAAIAYGQYRNAALKLQLDLFDRRFKVYEATGTIMTAMSLRKTLTLTEFMDFRRETSGAYHFFGPEVDDYLAELTTRAMSMVDVSAKSIADTESVQLSTAELLEATSKEHARREAAFRRYLRVPHRV